MNCILPRKSGSLQRWLALKFSPTPPEINGTESMICCGMKTIAIYMAFGSLIWGLEDRNEVLQFIKVYTVYLYRDRVEE